MSVIHFYKVINVRYLASLCVLTVPIAAVIFYKKFYNKPKKRKMPKEKLLELVKEDVYTLLVKKIGHTSFEVLNFFLSEFEGKIGLLGDHMILNTSVNIFINGREEYDVTFFVKFFPYSSETQRHFCLESGAFKKEIFVYELMDLIKQSTNLLDCVPNYYFSRNDHVIVTENMSERNFKLVDKMQTLNYDEVKIILQSLAKFHASTIIYEQKQSEQRGLKYRLIDEYQDDFEETFFNDKENFVNASGMKASLKGILSEIDIFDCPKKLNSGKNFKEVLENIFFDICKLTKPSKTIRNVLCHGDLWATNFLIKYDNDKPIDCVFVDFQQGRYSPPSHDLMSFLYLNTTREFRKNNLYEIIGNYYTIMEKFLKVHGIDIKEIWNFDDFVSSCENQKLFALLQTATYLQLVLADKDYLKKVMNDSKLGWTVLNEDRTPMIVKNVENAIYRNRLNESILDLLDYCAYL
nr:uncharacterized protein LOC111421318 [Onthophagus taurus]